jgi:hypothetical protein
MRRILINKRGEFSYKSKQSNSLGYAIKKLGAFFESVDRKSDPNKQVEVSNNTLNSDASKARAG